MASRQIYYHDHMSINPKILGGKLVMKGTRIPALEAQEKKPTLEEVLSLAGAWGEFGEAEWEQVEQELDNIRHANPPTPPLAL